ncbi:MAG: hypothetical protein LBB66_05045 [Desulfovibrio sp.]|nr:hypothetical protein [Desulfovibrio sp.]
MQVEFTIFISLATFSSLAACLSVRGTFRAIEELKRQREATYRPDIAYSSFVLSDMQRSPTIQICNTGLGVAKDVAVDISVPLDDALPAFNEAFLDENHNLSTECGDLKFETTWADGTVVSRTYSTSCAKHVQYLSPGKEIETAVPLHFLELLRLVTVRVFEKEDESSKELLKMFKLKIRVEFSDAVGKRYRSEYVCSLFDARFDYETRKYSLCFK